MARSQHLAKDIDMSDIRVTRPMALYNSMVVFDERDGKWKLDLGHTIEGQRGQFKDELELINAITEKRRADPLDQNSKLISYVRTVGIAKEGKPGPMGPQGPMGAPGGPQGPQGDRGPQGEPGKPGVNGRDGNQGPPGERGRPGADGRDGRDGKDGAAGQQGPPGVAGKDGKDGKNGRDGIDGNTGPRGEQGLQGERGIQGPPGIDGWIKAIMAEDFHLWSDSHSDVRPVNRESDKRNPSLKILRFDDTKSMGAGFFVTFPRAATVAVFRIRARHTQVKDEQLTRFVCMQLKFREIGTHGVGSWTTIDLAEVLVPYTEFGKERYRTYHTTLDFSALKTYTDYQMMLIRKADAEKDDLPGDFMIQSLVIDVD